jgi:hypothetical protein
MANRNERKRAKMTHELSRPTVNLSTIKMGQCTKYNPYESLPTYTAGFFDSSKFVKFLFDEPSAMKTHVAATGRNASGNGKEE